MLHLRTWFSIVIVTMALSGFSAFSVWSQGNSPWEPAQVIPLYTDIYPPIMVPDQNRTAHAFNSESQADDSIVIYYRKWSLDQGWTTPVDILLINPSRRDALQDVLLDPLGRFHMVYFSGVLEQQGNLLYTRAWASEADQSQTWADPVEIGINVGPLLSADLAWSGDNYLTLVFSGKENGVGLYEVHSEDGGDTWTEPVRITPPYEEGIWPFHIQIEFDDEGRLHVVWGMVDSSGIGKKVYYTRREADGVTWRNPYLLAAAEGNDYGADWPSIINYHDQLIVLYMDGTIPNGIPPTRWMRISEDNGSTWSKPIQPFLQVGENGTAVLLVDSSDNLHTLFANRVGEPPISGMWHANWIGDQWGEPELITARSEQAAAYSGSYADGGSASRPNAVVVQGNVILSAWWHDMRNQPPAAYSSTRINGPEYPIVPLPEVVPTPTPSPIPAIIETNATPTAIPSFTGSSGSSDDRPAALSVTTTLFLGLIPVLILVVIVVGVQRFRIRKTSR